MNDISKNTGMTKTSTLYSFVLKLIKRKNILYHFDHLLFSNKKIDTNETIMIAGAPRSGTTWLTELLMTLPDYTSIMEPLNPIWFPEAFKIGFKSRTYLPQDAEWMEGENYFRKILNCKITSQIPPYQLNIEIIIRRILAHKLIVKDIRFNRLLPWITKRFRFRSTLFVIRHPCAVVAAQLRSGISGYNSTFEPYEDVFPTIKNIINEASEIDTLDSSLLNKLKKIKSLEEIIAASWCLDNFIPLSLPKPHPWIIVTYEKLLMQSEKEIVHIFDKVGAKNVPKEAIRYFKKPSLVTLISDLKTIANADEQLSKWRRSLSKEQVERILNIVSDFGLDFYSWDLEPDYKNICIN
jgi:hypothetical protein